MRLQDRDGRLAKKRPCAFGSSFAVEVLTSRCAGENGRQAPAGVHPENLTSHVSVVLRLLLSRLLVKLQGRNSVPWSTATSQIISVHMCLRLRTFKDTLSISLTASSLRGGSSESPVISSSAACSSSSSRLPAVRGELFASDNVRLGEIKTKHRPDL